MVLTLKLLGSTFLFFSFSSNIAISDIDILLGDQISQNPSVIVLLNTGYLPRVHYFGHI